MGVTNIQFWADTLEVTRLPDITQDIALLEAQNLAADALLSNTIQTLGDRADANAAAAAAAMAAANLAQGRATAALTEVHANDTGLQALLLAEIQDLRDDLTASIAAVYATLGLSVIEGIDSRFDARLAGLLIQMDAAMAELNVELAGLRTQLDAFDTASTEIMNAVVPSLTEIQGVVKTSVDALKARMDIFLTDFMEDDLMTALDQMRIDVAAEASLVAVNAASLAQAAAEDAATIAETAASNTAAIRMAAEEARDAALDAVIEAGLSGEASSASAIAAGTSEGNAYVSEGAAATSVVDAAGSANAAAESAEVSASNAALTSRTAEALFPYDFTQDGMYWTGQEDGVPGAKSAIDASWVFSTDAVEGRMVTVASPITVARSISPKGYIIPVVDNKYRVTVRARHVGPFMGNSQNALGIRFRSVSGAYVMGTVLSTTNLSFAFPNVWHNLVAEYVYSGSEPLMSAAVYTRVANYGTAGAAIRISKIIVKDITSEAAAAASADAAATSTEAAAISSSAAGEFASAAAISATNAATSYDDASDASDLALEYSGTAFTHAEAASISASDALESKNAAAISAGTAATARTDALDAADLAADHASTASTDAGQASESASNALESEGKAYSYSIVASESMDAAGNRATAANNSASSALTSEGSAGRLATAANNSKIEAEAAKSASETARDSAVLAQEGAEIASSLALDTLSLTSRTIARGQGVLSDPYLGRVGSGGFVSEGAGGSQTQAANKIYPMGKTWITTVAAGDTRGMAVRSNAVDPIWSGPTDALGYVIEVDFTITSGASLAGAGLRFDWDTTGSDVANRTDVALTNITRAPFALNKLLTATTIVKRPASLAGGAFSRNELILYANGAVFGTMTAKTMEVHRISIRVATAEELGGGQVEAAFNATLSSNYYTSAATNTAIASQISTFNASGPGGDMVASVAKSATAMVNLNGAVARATNLVSVDGGYTSAGFELVAWNTAGVGTGTAVKMHGDNIIMPGTLTASSIVVVDGTGNLVLNPRFEHGDFRGWQNLNPLITIGDRNAVGQLAMTTAPSRYTMRFPATTSGNISGIPLNLAVVLPGERFALKFQYAMGGGVRHANLHLNMNFYDKAGVFLAGSAGINVTAVSNSTWMSKSGEIVAPANAATCSVTMFRAPHASSAGDAYVTDIECVRKREGATLINPGSITTDQLRVGGINANVIGAGVMNARHLEVTERLNMTVAAGFSVGKQTAYDQTTHGLYFGKAGTAGFGFITGRTNAASEPEYIQHTAETGLKIANANYLLGGGTPSTALITTSQTYTFPAGSKSFEASIVGGGGGGRGRTTVGSAGASTTITLYDGAVAVPGKTWTATGGAGGTIAGINNVGQASFLGAGGRGSGGNGASMQATEPGGETYTNEGGKASDVVSTPTVDISGLTSPKLVITIGAAGVGGTTEGSSGIAGGVQLTRVASTMQEAGVIARKPLAVGTFVVTAAVAGSFPVIGNGKGLWVLVDVPLLWTVNLTVDNTSFNTKTNAGTMSFISNKTPTWNTTHTTTRTVQYAYYPM